MSSATISSYTSDVQKGVGGLRVVRMVSAIDVLSIFEKNGIVESIKLKENKQFYTFELAKNVSSIQITPNLDATGLKWYDERLNLAFNKLNFKTTLLLQKLVKTTLLCIVEDKNGEGILIGRNLGMWFSGGSIGCGTGSGDRNGYEIQLTGKAKILTHLSRMYLDSFYNAVIDNGIFETQFETQFE
jgi:hypothetical protein